MAAKHTPGPWLHRGKNDSVYTAPPAGSVYKFGDHIFTFHDEEGPLDEDLQLILAAPEQHDALVEFDAAFSDFDPESRESRDRMRRAVIKARAAIAKATGSES